MAKNSKIEWTHHTFNPWWGCAKLSPACDNCYAETWARRVGEDLWGAKADRRFFGDVHWHAPLKWNREAGVDNVRRRVFCASMADVFEDRRDLDTARSKLWGLIEQTPNLDWLLLTKRPHTIGRLVPWIAEWPSNVWLGTTAENQKWAEKRIREIVKHRARVRFLSCEPLLGALNLERWLGTDINWVIAGGESGGKSRPTDPAWVRGLRDQCAAAAVPFHFKQWGNWAPLNEARETARVKQLESGERVVRMAKQSAGRQLDGQVWDGAPG